MSNNTADLFAYQRMIVDGATWEIRTPAGKPTGLAIRRDGQAMRTSQRTCRPNNPS